MVLSSFNIKIIYFIFLLFHLHLSHFFFEFNSLYVEAFFSGSLYMLAFILLNPHKINPYLLVAVIISFFSLMIGIYNDWYLGDIIGDSYRYVAPILGFAVGLKLLDEVNSEGINKLIKIILIIYTSLFLFDVIEFLIIALINNNELFTYVNRINIDVSPILFIFGYLLFIQKPFNYYTLLFAIVAFFTISIMLINLSKANFILIFLYMLIPMIILKKHLMNTFLIILILILFVILFDLIEYRINPMTKTISDFIILNEINTHDYSTASRLTEVSTIFKSFSNNILMIFTGFGNGSLLMGIESSAGINPINFRENGGLHHIHIEYFSLLYRNGIIGLLFYVYWQLYIIRKSLVFTNNHTYSVSLQYLFSICIGTYIIGISMIAFTNAGFYGKLGIGLLAALVIKISNLKKHNE